MSAESNFQLLWQEFSSLEGTALWVLDENPPLNTPPVHPDVLIICNRYDVAKRMQHLGWSVQFSDFAFSKLIANSFDRIFYRISKEKALTHYVINSAKSLLSSHGQLIISGGKQEGIKGYIERASQRYQMIERYKADKLHWGARYSLPGTEFSLDDKDYLNLRETVSEGGTTFVSKPGIFGWNKIDRGSQLLITHLQSLNLTKGRIENVLDLGCGYGYLSVLAANLLNAHVTATDNNVTALQACEANLIKNKIDHQIIAANCADIINDKFDLIICNPPFHTGFSVENDLTDVFLKTTARLLKANAIALFVVNLHIPLERKAAKFFSNVKVISDDKHFKVMLLQA